MNDEREIARLTFWMGADAAKEYAAHLTCKRLAEEEASRPALYGAAVEEPDHDE